MIGFTIPAFEHMLPSCTAWVSANVGLEQR
jgi:hypothetical protein